MDTALKDGNFIIPIPITPLLRKRPKIKDFWDTNIPLKMGIGATFITIDFVH